MDVASSRRGYGIRMCQDFAWNWRMEEMVSSSNKKNSKAEKNEKPNLKYFIHTESSKKWTLLIVASKGMIVFAFISNSP